MKAKAPEKIYIHPDIGGREFLRPWLDRPANNESVEYVRKDTFIEKACEWLKENSNRYFDKVGTIFGTVRVVDSEKIVSDFKKVMKGE